VLKAHVDTLKKREKKDKKTASATAHFIGCAHIFIIADFQFLQVGFQLEANWKYVYLCAAHPCY
jgi:hypothetical protein